MAPRAGPLDDGLGTKEKAFAEHLRSLRDQTGMTSADLAAALAVDATRLSRYLSGQSLPPPTLLTDLHRLLAGPGAESSVWEAARESRALLYAAAESKGPLSARACEVAALQEKLGEQQTETDQALAELRDELERERDRRQQVEREIEWLRQTDAADRDERVRRLEAERDSALRRVAELEDQVTQTGAILRLQQGDIRHAAQMAEATADELERWEDGHGTLPAAPKQQEEGTTRHWPSGPPRASGPAVTPEGDVQALAGLRDTDRDDEADGLIDLIALQRHPRHVFYLWRELGT